MESKDFLFYFFSNQDADFKRFKTRKYYLPKGIKKSYNVIIKRKLFYDQSFDYDIKQYQKIIKFTTREDEDYTSGCLLDYYYIKTYYRLLAADLSRQKELDADPKAIQQKEFVGKLKKTK